MWMLHRILQTSVGQTQSFSLLSTKLIFLRQDTETDELRRVCACWGTVETYKWQIACPDDDNIWFWTGSPPVLITVQTIRVKTSGLQYVSAMYATGFLGYFRIFYVTAIKGLHVVKIECFKLYHPSIDELSCTTQCFCKHILFFAATRFGIF